ncbi:MAG: BamA/TamA family outer membrane protein [Alphaproteobacteria bacterium]|nr:BamA/TamA family outer membrane protein [Alphaproteobacteria bacterium]
MSTASRLLASATLAGLLAPFARADEAKDAEDPLVVWEERVDRWSRAGPPTVRDISFVENKRFLRIVRGTNDNNVRTAMEQGEAGFGAHLPLLRWVVERPELNMETLERDAYRIELWYAHQGYFDAQVTGWELQPYRSARPWFVTLPRFRAPSMDVVGVVDEGPASKVDAVYVDGIELAGKAFRLKIDRSTKDVVGSTFTLSAAYALRDLVVELLQEQSYARAAATVEIDARPEEQQVTIRITADPGPPCVLGEVSIVDNEGVPTEMIRDELTIQPGQAYSPQRLSDSQSALFNLGTFSVVQLVPDLSVEGSVIPVTVRVTETRFRRLRVGGGFAKSPGEAQVRARTEFTHTNMAGRLINLETSATGGYKVFRQGAPLTFGDIADAITGGTTSTTETTAGTAAAGVSDLADSSFGGGPFLDLGTELLWPQPFGLRKLRINPDVGFELGRDFSQTYRFLEISPGFTWQFTRRFSVSPSYHFEWWDTDLQFTDTSRPELGAREQFDTYTLHYLKVKLIYDARDHPIYTRRGYYGEISFKDAGAPLFPGFTFGKIEFDARKYWAVVRPVRSVAALRVAGGAVRPYALTDARADDAFVPYNDLFQLGGSNDVRGWEQGYLGPRACYQETFDSDGNSTGEIATSCNKQRGSSQADNVNIYPLGSQAVAWVSLEYRITGPFSIDWVVFTDVGSYWASLSDIREAPLANIYPTVGAGLRYRSPVGPIRVDFGWKVRPMTGQYQLDRRFGLHLALLEAF